MTRPGDVLRFLADLAPTGGNPVFDVATRTGEFVWLGSEGIELFTSDRGRVGSALPDFRERDRDRADSLDHLAALDRLNRGGQLVRQGWVFLVGEALVDGEHRTLLLPLLSQAVTLVGRRSASARVVSDRLMLSLIDDPDDRAELELSVDFTIDPQDPVITGWIRDVVDTLGLTSVDGSSLEIRGPELDPTSLRGQAGLSAVIGSALYTDREIDRPSQESSLRNWADLEATDSTASGRIWAGASGSAERRSTDGDGTVDEQLAAGEVNLPLNQRQRSAIVSTRTEIITTVTGAPGTGKSHVLVAAVIDAISRGETVLVATGSDQAAASLVEMLDEHDAPTPVVFGSSEDRDLVSEELIELVSDPIPEADARRLVDEAAAARQRSRRVRDQIAAKILAEQRYVELATGREEMAEAAGLVPVLAASGADPAELLDHLDRAESSEGLFSSSRRRRALERLHKACGTSASTDLVELRQALQAAADLEELRSTDRSNGLTLEDAWPELISVDAEARRTLAVAIDAATRSRGSVDNEARQAVGALAAALRTGRGSRRRFLRNADLPTMIRALPLWLGSVDDITDILPATPGMFDLVVIDEASQIDQLRSAGALLRARRAVIVGDPAQLRHESCVSDQTIESVAHDRSIASDLRPLIDVRRVSTFDLAVAAAPPITLDEHFRSAPTLVEFPTQRFYGGDIGIMTRRPHVEANDAVEVCRVSGARNDEGVNAIEVAAVVEQLRGVVANDQRSIGVITPFRPQADALSDAIINGLGVDVLDRVDVRVSTVHGFQGTERDLVIASWVVDGPDDRAWPFLNDPHLFNVMVTRARERLIVVTSIPATSAGDSLAQDFLRAENRVAAGASDGRGSAWAHQVGSRITERSVRYDYVVGGWTVDLVVGGGDGALAVTAEPHPDGPDAHIERFLALDGAGWRQVDAFASRWLERPEEAASRLTELSDQRSWPRR